VESIPDQTLTEDGSATTTVNLSGHFEPHEPFFQDGRFTDSTGRTIHYRLQLRSDWDRTEPRGLVINFHGNNRGSPQQMLEWFGHNEAALDMGLIHAAVASPRSYTEWELSLEDDGTRSWSPQDARLIHELLRSHFDGNATIDHDRIVFQGGSQGPCFINHFLATYGHAYGGGFYSICGCLWPHGLINPWHPTIQWTPHMASSVSQRFRVFVQITTEDFLFAESVAMRDLYHDVLGFETRWDFDAPGGHCSPGVTPYGEILEWLSASALPGIRNLPKPAPPSRAEIRRPASRHARWPEPSPPCAPLPSGRPPPGGPSFRNTTVFPFSSGASPGPAPDPCCSSRKAPPGYSRPRSSPGSAAGLPSFPNIKPTESKYPKGRMRTCPMPILT